MLLLLRVFACSCLLLSAAAGETPSPTPSQLEALERYANATAAHVVWSKEVARIDTDRAHAVITALVIEDETQSTRRMRGVRIDLSGEGAKDRVYTSEEHLDRLIGALDEIANGSPRFFSRSAAPRRCFGSGVFWQQNAHAFSASECVFDGWTGLSVGPGSFRFTGLDPSTFAAAFASAQNEIRSH